MERTIKKAACEHYSNSDYKQRAEISHGKEVNVATSVMRKAAIESFEAGAEYLKSLLLEKLQVYKGAMILDGYEPEDSCIKFMNELIEEINGGEYSSWISVKKRLPKPEQEVLLYDSSSILHYVVAWLRKNKGYNESIWSLNNGYVEDEGITHWMPIPE